MRRYVGQLSGHATVGFTPGDFDSDPDGNELRLDVNEKHNYESLDRKWWVAVVAHEVGHVFGLRHVRFFEATQRTTNAY